MLSINKIKYLSSLHLKKYRNIHQEFIAEGNKMVLDLLTSDLEIKEVYATQRFLDENLSKYEARNIMTAEVTLKDLKKITALSSAGEVLAVIKMPVQEMDLKIVDEELILMIDSIRDPGNLGTIIRTADWFGISTIVCSNDSVDVYNPKVVQASMGSIARVKVYFADLTEVLSKISPETKVYGTFMSGENLYEKKLQNKGVIIIGSESKGISSLLLPFINEKISIPAFAQYHISSGNAESLNAAVASAIVCYEFRRTANLFPDK